MANTIIKLKKSLISGHIPADLEHGELAINAADGYLFYKNSSNTIKYITSDTTTNAFSTINVSSNLLLATSPTDILNLKGSNSIEISADPLTNIINISAENSSTTQRGVVQLYNGTDSTSTTLAATANAVKDAYDLANSAFNIAQSGGGSGGNISAYLDALEFTASENQSSFVVSGGYKVGKISIHVNGALLSLSDFTADDGAIVRLIEPLNAGDIVSISKWKTDVVFSANTVTFYETSEQILDTYELSEFSTSKYLCQIKHNSSIHSSEILVVHDGTFAYMTEYGIVKSDITLGVYNADLSSGYIRLLFTPTSANTIVRFKKIPLET